MKIQVALLVAACAAPAVMGQGCGPGTYLDTKSGFCAAGIDPRVERRAANNKPSIRTDNGNVVIAVDGAGAQVGYRIGDSDIVYFDQMDSSIRGQVPAISLGYTFGQQAKGTSAILDYLKTDLSDRVAEIAGAQSKIEATVQTNLDAASGKTTQQLADAQTKSNKQLADAQTKTTQQLAQQKKEVDTKISTLTQTVTADLKATKDTIDKDVTGNLKILIAKTACLNENLKFNPEDGKCCKKGEEWNAKEKKCKNTLNGLTEASAAKNCRFVLLAHPIASDGLFWMKPNEKIKAFLVWCTFKGDYKASALVIKRPSNVGGRERHINALSVPFNAAPGGYSKLSDVQINALKETSTEKDPYISLSYKSRNGNPFCRAYAKKACDWNMGGAAGSKCANTPVRNSNRYCRQTNAGNHYRGMDGYYCNNGISYNNGNPYPNGGIREDNRPFIIFEHSGGSHYCGGHDTSWDHIELWIQ